ncbi:MAG: gamma-glutamyl-gamma-aminobutyrate hydrolase family protein [Tenericutes bacterium]|nr:gamma-glutamyl-gamma-aminobutyrate hydrolase family protein [Mycoplasmatota bacterium]
MKKLLLVDYGSYYFKDVLECMDLLEVKYVEYRYDELSQIVNKDDICGILLSGGPGRVNNPKDPHLDKALLDYQVPILGICYGMQILMHFLGGKVEALFERDYGLRDMTILKESRINKGLMNPIPVWMAHYDHITCLAPGFELLARTDISIAMIAMNWKKSTPFNIIQKLKNLKMI